MDFSPTETDYLLIKLSGPEIYWKEDEADIREKVEHTLARNRPITSLGIVRDISTNDVAFKGFPVGNKRFFWMALMAPRIFAPSWVEIALMGDDTTKGKEAIARTMWRDQKVDDIMQSYKSIARNGIRVSHSDSLESVVVRSKEFVFAPWK